jgi:phosphate/sulfate permease
MTAVCLATFSFIIISSVFEMPISGTHTVVGALLGAGLVGTDDVNAKGLIKIVASWFISPIVAAILACIFMTVFMHFTMDSLQYSFSQRIWALQGVLGLYLTSIASIILFILQKKYVPKS